MCLLFSSKNTVNILMKNLLDVFLGGVSYWAIGWGLAYGDNGNPFCGGDHFFNYELDYSAYPKWFFQVKNIWNGNHIHTDRILLNNHVSVCIRSHSSNNCIWSCG